MMKNLQHVSNITYHSNFKTIDEPNILQLCKRSIAATKDAYAPYSSFKVGAAVLMADHSMISGNNQENAVYPLGLCAERVAIYSASSQHPNKVIVAIAVATSKEIAEKELPPFPCGSCRQVILEMEQRQMSDIAIYIVGSDHTVCHVNSVKDLLPFAFDVNSL